MIHCIQKSAPAQTPILWIPREMTWTGSIAEDREDEEEIQDRAKKAAEVPQRGNKDYLE